MFQMNQSEKYDTLTHHDAVFVTSVIWGCELLMRKTADGGADIIQTTKNKGKFINFY